MAEARIETTGVDTKPSAMAQARIETTGQDTALFAIRCCYDGIGFSQTLLFEIPTHADLLMAVRRYLATKSPRCAKQILRAICEHKSTKRIPPHTMMPYMIDMDAMYSFLEAYTEAREARNSFN